MLMRTRAVDAVRSCTDENGDAHGNQRGEIRRVLSSVDDAGDLRECAAHPRGVPTLGEGSGDPRGSQIRA